MRWICSISFLRLLFFAVILINIQDSLVYTNIEKADACNKLIFDFQIILIFVTAAMLYAALESISILEPSLLIIMSIY